MINYLFNLKDTVYLNNFNSTVVGGIYFEHIFLSNVRSLMFCDYFCETVSYASPIILNSSNNLEMRPRFHKQPVSSEFYETKTLAAFLYQDKRFRMLKG